MQLLKANAAVDVLIGPFIDDTDGKTAETALTLSQADIKLSKNGQALAQKNDATAAAHDANGYYNCELDATDTNTEGTLVLIVHESGALPIRHEYMVMAEAAYDSLFAAKDTGYMDVNVKAVSEDTAAADNLESACDNYSVTRGLSGTALPAAAADGVGGLPISDAGGLDLDTQIGTDIDAILDDTNELQTDNVPGLIAVLNDISTAEVNAEVDSALSDIHLDHLLAADYDPASKPGTATALLNELVENDAGVSRFTENALEQAPSGAGSNAADIADAVWDETTADHNNAGSTGLSLAGAASAGDPWGTALPGAYGAGTAGKLVGDNVDAPISGVPTVAQIRAEVDANSTQLADIVADTNELQTDNVPGLIGALNDPTAVAVADQVWEEAKAGHANAGTFGLELANANAAATAANTAATAANIAATAANVSAAAANTTAGTANTTAGTAVTDIGALNDLSAAQVNAEVLDVLNVDTFGEPGQGSPGATLSIFAKINYLYKAWRNKKTQDANNFQLYNDAEAVVDQKSSVSDDGNTTTFGEMGTGA